MKLVEKTVFMDAAPARVYELLTDATLLPTWMGVSAAVDARPGGDVSWTHANGDTCSGQFVELVPDRRVVFTWGWEREDVEIPPGSTTVEIDLLPRDGGTEVRLVHRGLPGPMADAHAGGWDNYLGRLADVAAGRDPGPDALERERVPSARQVGLA
jgi:uncharacterized protein YndB with AHSA1/START domain